MGFFDKFINEFIKFFCFIHARAGEERYAGTPHYDMIEGLRSEMSVPLIVSGNIYSLDDAVRAQRMTGAEGVMLARGAVGDPFLVTQVDRYFRTGERLPNPTVSQQVEWCLRLMDMLADDKGEEYMMKKMHCFAPRFISGCTGSRDLRGRLASASGDRAALTALLLEISDEKGDETVYPNGRCGLSDIL